MNASLTAGRLTTLGWTPERATAFSAHAAAGFVPARVLDSATGRAMTASGPVDVIVQRRSARDAGSGVDLPAIGDWLALEPVAGDPSRAALRHVLPRRGTFTRQRASDGRPQVLAANVDLAFLVSGLDHDLNLRRIERYLALARDGEITPVVVLNKVDAAIDLPRAVAEVHRVAAGTRVIESSALHGNGLDELRSSIGPGITACLLGSSGVGKSTLTNALLGDQRQVVRELRDHDSKGRHTTAHRELFVLPGGGMLIDTPGLRTVGVLGGSAALARTFTEIDALARECRFRDCLHRSEPGCAVRAALEQGDLATDRYESHQKLEAERRSVELRADERARRQVDRQQGRFYRRTARQAERYKRGGG